MIQCGKLALASKNAVQLAVWCEKAYALRRHYMTGGGDEGLAGGKRSTLRDRVGDIHATAHAGEPVGE